VNVYVVPDKPAKKLAENIAGKSFDWFQEEQFLVSNMNV
jgi:hypothetical protein